MKNNIPQGYKATALGIIPQEWEMKTLGQIANVFSGTTPSRENELFFNDGTIPWVKTTDLNNGILTHTEERITDIALKSTTLKVFSKGTVLIAMYGGFNQIGRTSILGIDATINQALSALILNTKEITEYFLLYWLLYRVNKWKRYAASSRKDPNITKTDVTRFPILVPPLAEQRKIAEVLGVWDEAIEKQARLIEKLALRKRALMQRLLSAKLRLPGFSEPWKKVNYSDILKEVRRTLTWDENELYDLISVRRRSGGVFHRESLYGHEIKTKTLRPALEGDLLISKMQIVHGASGVVPKQLSGMKISGSYIALIAKDPKELNINYFNLWSQMPLFYHQTFVSSYGVHIEKMTFDLDAFMSLSMNLPPIEEQNKIVEVISTATNEIELAKEKLERLRRQKRGLMQQLLTGKKRVKY